jgi:aryl-alcohol dehydrogenase-like predicted oxidoreductase
VTRPVTVPARILGRGGPAVFPVCLGGNVFGWTVDEAASGTLLDAYLALGGNLVDTADRYSAWAAGHRGGESETVIGRWLASRGRRDQVMIATKVGGEMPAGRGLSRDHILRSIDGSLRRLQTDYVDIYYAHYDDPDTPMEETLEAFDGIVRSGKARFIAASNFGAGRLTAALAVSRDHGYARYQALQAPYSLAVRGSYETELEAVCTAEGLGVLAYAALADGFLTGKYTEDGELPDTPRAQDVRDQYFNPAGWQVLAALRVAARELGLTPAQVAIAWVLARPGVTAPIVSATTTEQLAEIMAAVLVRLPEPIITLLDSASAPP